MTNTTNTVSPTTLRLAKRFLMSEGQPCLPTDSDSNIIAMAELHGWVNPEPAPEPAALSDYQLQALDWIRINRPSINHNAAMSNEDKVSIAETAGFTYVMSPTPTPTPMIPTPEPELTSQVGVEDAMRVLMGALQPKQPVQQLDEAHIVEIIKKHMEPVTTVKNIISPAVTTKVKGAHKSLSKVVKRLNAGYNVYLYGEAGCGKTTLAEQAAKSLDVPFYHTGAMMQKYELTGFLSANNDYQETSFYKCFKDGGLYLFDEIDGSMASAIIAFNAAIANRIMYFPNGETLTAHADFKVIAAANTNGQGATANYKRNALDGATLDRFCRIKLEIDTALEKRLAKAEFERTGGVDDAIFDDWLDTVREARKAAKKARIDVIISPRSSITGAGILGMGDSKKDALAETFGASLSKDQAKQLGL